MSFASIWSKWAQAFEPLPYGDPYIAGVCAAFLLFFIVRKFGAILRHVA